MFQNPNVPVVMGSVDSFDLRLPGLRRLRPCENHLSGSPNSLARRVLVYALGLQLPPEKVVRVGLGGLTTC